VEREVEQAVAAVGLEPPADRVVAVGDVLEPPGLAGLQGELAGDRIGGGEPLLGLVGELLVAVDEGAGDRDGRDRRGLAGRVRAALAAGRATGSGWRSPRTMTSAGVGVARCSASQLIGTRADPGADRQVDSAISAAPVGAA
jgi:hypothetical protein